MKILLLKLALLAGLVISFMSLALLLPAPKDDPSYLAALIDKHKLLSDTRPPRIIFIGGSNLAFGLDSRMVEESTGMRTVNMSLHAGLGLRYIMSEVEPYIGKGDVIVVVPEYEYFFGTIFNGGRELSLLYLTVPESRRYIKSYKQYFAILRYYPYALRSRIFDLFVKHRLSASSDYCRKVFNEYGDSVGHLGKARPAGTSADCRELAGEINRDAAPELNHFKAYADKVGARVFLSYPCIPIAQYRKNEKKIDLVRDMLDKKLKIPAISTPSDYVFPETYFYDSIYHLTAEGRDVRTKEVVSHLKKVL